MATTSKAGNPERWVSREARESFTLCVSVATLVAKLPARQKVTVLCFRRSNPDEILLVQREVKRALEWGLPTAEVEGESLRDAALRLAARTVDGDPLAEVDLDLCAEYRVSAGPRAGEWTERFYAVEVAPGRYAIEGRWLPHYEAKAQVAGGAPRLREAMTRLRERARLKP